MLSFIFKIQTLLSKKRQLVNILLEREFIRNNYSSKLNDDEELYKEKANNLRKDLAKMVKEKKELPENLNKEISELDQEAKEIVYYKNILDSSFKSEEEIKYFIELVKKSIWS